MIELPIGPHREYLSVFGVAAVYVAAPPDGKPCEVGFSSDLERSRAFMIRRWPEVAFKTAYWVKDRKTARLLAREVKEQLPRQQDGRLAVPYEQAIRAVLDQAAKYRITLTDHETAMSRVGAAVVRVTTMLEKANRSGELQWFNRAYQQWRRNGGTFSYTEARARLRRLLVMRIAGGENCDTVSLPELFPKSLNPMTRL